MDALHHERRTVSMGALLLCSIVGGCALSGIGAALPGSPAASPAPSVRPTAASPATSAAASPTASPSAPPDALETCAGRTLAGLTERQRIGQLFLVGLPADRLSARLAAAIRTYGFGSVWYTRRTTAGVAAVRLTSDAVQALATRAATGRVRFFVAANQEGGPIQALAGPGFDTIPSAVEQGALDPPVLRTLAARWGRQLRAAGVNLDFAPVADVVPPGTDDQNAPIGELRRELGNDPVTVAAHVAAFIRGMRTAGVATSGKHFPGLGRVAANTDTTAGVVDTVTTTDDPYLRPFARAIRVGVPFVMVSLATYDRIDPDHLAAFSRPIMRRLLRRQLGFTGVVLADSLTAKAVSSIDPGTRAIRFLRAGGDLIVVGPTGPAVKMATAIASRVRTSATFRARVDDAALRVLEAKAAAALLPCS